VIKVVTELQHSNRPITHETWEAIPSLNTAVDPGWSTFSWVRFLISREVTCLERRLNTKSRNPDAAGQIG